MLLNNCDLKYFYVRRISILLQAMEFSFIILIYLMRHKENLLSQLILVGYTQALIHFDSKYLIYVNHIDVSIKISLGKYIFF